MHIEFHTPPGEVKEWLILHMKEQLVELHHLEPSVFRAQVHFRTTGNQGKIVEVDIPSFGSSLFIHRTASSYEQAMREVIGELRGKITERYEARNMPPDEITSSVQVEPFAEEEEPDEF